ncbi:MAG: hypothetical protein JO184_12885 [Gammaproteobacteria bacterium]|nr:hypothetical protein [Gammaproteobacteria bacterium]MBV8402642.1 hypothetical protein [Gammaproteobacteria bacterium]
MEAEKLRQPDSEPFQLSLRIRHPSLDPGELSRELDIEATHCFRAGEPRASRSGIASVHPESYWLGALNTANWPVDMSFPGVRRLLAAQERIGIVATRSLAWALSLSTRFFNSHAETLRRIGAEGGQVSLLITAPASAVGSFSLVPAVSRVFSDLGITLEFEFTSD